MTKNQCHGRFVESFGRLHLAQNLHDAGYACAEPIIDNGIDLVVYSPVSKLYATLQMKAFTDDRYDVKRKYEGVVDLLVFVCRARSSEPKIYAVEYAEIEEKVIKANGYDKTESWNRKDNAGWGSTIGAKLHLQFDEWIATPQRWHSLLRLDQ